MKKLLFILLSVLLFQATVSAADYYWVGGSGRWDEIAHWQNSSGNPVGIVPSAADNVYFNSNSNPDGGTMTITVNSNSFCRDIIFDGVDGTPELRGTSTLTVHGSSRWQSGMVVLVNRIDYEAGEENYLDRFITINDVSMSETLVAIRTRETAAITLAGISATGEAVFSKLYLEAGTFKTDGHTLRTEELMAAGVFVSSALRTLDIRGSEVYLSSRFNTNSDKCTIIAGDSHVYMTRLSRGVNFDMSGYVGQELDKVTYEDITVGSTSAPRVSNMKMNRLEFKTDGVFYGNCVMDTLILAAGRKYILTSGNANLLTVNQSFTAGVACQGWTTIQSTSETAAAKISMPAGAEVNLHGVALKNITAEGEADFAAEESMDLGGNSANWTISNTNDQPLYWVGAEGSWNDPANWSLSSGGPGGACVPSRYTDVIFDDNSGFDADSKTVTVDAVSYCKDITFSGTSHAPILTSKVMSDLCTLNIYGSSVWQGEGMEITVHNLIYQNTDESKTITSNGAATKSIITINEKGTISLVDDFKGTTIYHDAGTFDTNSKNMELKTFTAIRTQQGTYIQRTVKLSNSQIYMVKDYENVFSTNNSRVSVIADNSHIHFRGRYGDVFTAYSGQEFHDISFENPDASSIESQSPQIGCDGNRNLPLVFNKVSCMGAVKFQIKYANSAIEMNELYLAEGKVYRISGGRTMTIKQKFTIGETCGLMASLTTFGTSGTPAVISMPAGADVAVKRTIISNIHAEGGAVFDALDSVDESGNNGWNFVNDDVSDLYWVGGAGDWNDRLHWSYDSGVSLPGGACVPGPGNNVFFDGGSGFTAGSKDVTISGDVYCKNITVSGCDAAPAIQRDVNNLISILNIYGSSVWQREMLVAISQLNYRNTGEPKTITSNGVIMGDRDRGLSVNFYETTQISLTDSLNIKKGSIKQYAGTWNTNNFRVRCNRFELEAGKVNLGSSDIYLQDVNGLFKTSSSDAIINAGESNIYFLSVAGSRIHAREGQQFHNVIFENGGYIRGNDDGEGASYAKAIFRGRANLQGNNTFDNLELLSPYSEYILEAGKEQTVNNRLTMGGTPCNRMILRSSINGISPTPDPSRRAKLNIVSDEYTAFNFVDLRDIDATGQVLHFGDKSYVEGQNNNNITNDPYIDGEVHGLGDDWTEHVFDDNDPDTYTLSAAGFYGNAYTRYEWKKLGSDYVRTGTGDEFKELDISDPTLRYGTYTVQVWYTNGGVITPCDRIDQITVSPAGISTKVYINPNLRMRIKY